MKIHLWTPEQLAMYHERKTAGCPGCQYAVVPKNTRKQVCLMEDTYKIKLGYPQATRDDCKRFRPKEKK